MHDIRRSQTALIYRIFGVSFFFHPSIISIVWYVRMYNAISLASFDRFTFSVDFIWKWNRFIFPSPFDQSVRRSHSASISWFLHWLFDGVESGCVSLFLCTQYAISAHKNFINNVLENSQGNKYKTGCAKRTTTLDNFNLDLHSLVIACSSSNGTEWKKIKFPISEYWMFGRWCFFYSLRGDKRIFSFPFIHPYHRPLVP